MKARSLCSRRATARGYTIIEVIMALSVLAIGGMGVVALQKFTVIGAYNARAIAGATSAANGWLDVMQNEAAAWNVPTNTDIIAGATTTGPMPILRTAAASAGTWVAIPTTTPDSPNGPGTPIYGSTPVDMFYCSQVRVVFLGVRDPTQTGHTSGPGATSNLAGPTDIMRVDVRTYYAKNGRPVTTECGWAGTDVDGMFTSGNAPNGNSRWDYGFVYVSGTIRRNTLQ
jgi:prepilin-type N-terminal cleavage/methylation domain-containing protein